MDLIYNNYLALVKLILQKWKNLSHLNLNDEQFVVSIRKLVNCAKSLDITLCERIQNLIVALADPAINEVDRNCFRTSCIQQIGVNATTVLICKKVPKFKSAVAEFNCVSQGCPQSLRSESCNILLAWSGCTFSAAPRFELIIFGR